MIATKTSILRAWRSCTPSLKVGKTFRQSLKGCGPLFRRRTFMSNAQRTLLFAGFFLLLFSRALSQTPTPANQAPIPMVTATASSERVRYVSAGEVHQTRLQV